MLLSLSPLNVILAIPGVLYALVFHEFSHGLMADRLGDPTPRRAGRLTLDPWPHLDPIGTLALLLVGFGWAKPVPIDPRNFQRPRWDTALVALAGPAANLLTALPIAVVAVLIAAIPGLERVPGLAQVFQDVVLLDLALGVFNLVPIPPLDGSRLLSAILPNRLAQYYNRVERWGVVILLVLIFLLPRLVYIVLGGAIQGLTMLYLGLGTAFWHLFGIPF